MKIYKFKDLRDSTNHPHFLQIVRENKIWCAAPGSLNDEDEFRFRFDYEPSNATLQLLSKVLDKFGSSNFPAQLLTKHGLRNGKLEEIVEPIVTDMIMQCRESIGVTSFSTVCCDDWLWSEYGGSGYGARIEFELAEESIGKTFHLVDYVPERTFHIDVFLRSQITDVEEIFRKILCTKVRKWKDEQEIRFIGKRPNINFVLDVPITNVTFGEKVPSGIKNRFSHSCLKAGINVT